MYVYVYVCMHVLWQLHRNLISRSVCIRRVAHWYIHIVRLQLHLQHFCKASQRPLGRRIGGEAMYGSLLVICIRVNMYKCVCMYVWMDGWMDGWANDTHNALILLDSESIYSVLYMCVCMVDPYIYLMYVCIYVCMYDWQVMPIVCMCLYVQV